MHNNGFVPSPLNHTHLVNDINQCLGIGTQTNSIPLLHLELSHLLNLISLLVQSIHDHGHCNGDFKNYFQAVLLNLIDKVEVDLYTLKG